MNWQALRLSLKHANPLKVMACYMYYGIRHCIDLDIFHVMYLEADSPIRPAATNVRVDFDFVPAGVARRAAADASSGFIIDEVELALAHDEECFGAWMSHQVVSHLWFAQSGAHLCQDVHVHFSPSYAYSKWAYTRHEYRGQHLHSITKHHALNRLSQRGKLGILSMVDVANLPSLRAAHHSGCRRVGILLIGRVGKRRIIWASPGCREYHIQLKRVPIETAVARYNAKSDPYTPDRERI